MTCPVLALIGEKDFQVPTEANLAIIEAALKNGGNQEFLIKDLADLNHILQPCETGKVDEYAAIAVYTCGPRTPILASSPESMGEFRFG